MKFTVNKNKFVTCISEKDHLNAFVTCRGYTFKVTRMDSLPEEYVVSTGESGWTRESNILTSPMPGKVIKINVKKGEKVSRGQVVMVIEAMKMENKILAIKDAVVRELYVSLDQMVDGAAALIAFDKMS